MQLFWNDLHVPLPTSISNVKCVWFFQEPTVYGGGEAGYRQAFLDGIHEYNKFGAAAANQRYRIEEAEALTLFGFKASSLHFDLN